MTGFDLWLETCIMYWVWVCALYTIDPYPVHVMTSFIPGSRSPIVSFLNQIFVNGAVAMKLYSFPSGMHHHYLSDIPKIPLYFFLSSGLFYYMHRAFHDFRFLRYFHRHHHQWTLVKPMDTFDCHPVEQLCINLIPILFPAWILDVSCYTFRFILHASLLSSILAHLNWKNTLFTNQFHKLHHLTPSINFGQGTAFFDKLHGTYHQ